MITREAFELRRGDTTIDVPLVRSVPMNITAETPCC